MSVFNSIENTLLNSFQPEFQHVIMLDQRWEEKKNSSMSKYKAWHYHFKAL